MARDTMTSNGSEAVAVIDQQPASPATSASSREDTRDARERLKKTSIAGLKQSAQSLDPPSSDASIADLASESNNGIRGRPAKKRSFEDLAKDDADADIANAIGQPPLPKSGHHKRMRSRDVNSGDHTQAYTKIEGDRNNTVHEETDIYEETGMDAEKSPGGPAVLIDAPSQEEMDADSVPKLSQQKQSESREDGTQRQNTSEAASAKTKVPPTSGFANSSAASPFGQPRSSSREKSSEPTKPTSSSAFASSGLSAFASSDKSPFGAASSSKSPLGGGFGSSQTGGGFGSAKSGFGSTTGFSSTPSTFGTSSGGFGSTKPFGGPSTFGASKPFGTTSAFGGGASSFGTGKPIGASSKDDEDDEKVTEEDEDAASVAKDDAEQDPRFHEQQVDTGEQGEEVHFSSRARLYFFDGVWKERGTGVFKVNVKVTDDDDTETSDADVEAQGSNAKRKARLLMRADATHRILLNSPVFKGMKFGSPDGSEPFGKTMHLQSLEEGKPVPLQLKIGKEEVLKELYHHLRELEVEA